MNAENPIITRLRASQQPESIPPAIRPRINAPAEQLYVRMSAGEVDALRARIAITNHRGGQPPVEDTPSSAQEYEFSRNPLNGKALFRKLGGYTTVISLFGIGIGIGGLVIHDTLNSPEVSASVTHTKTTDASALNLGTLSQDVFDCKTPVATAIMSNEANIAWQVTATDGKTANLGPSIQGDNGAESRYPRVWFDQAPVDIAACKTEAMGPNPISVKDGKIWVNLGDVTLLPSFGQGKTQGAESLPIITPVEGAKLTFTPEEAKKVVAASATEANGTIAMETLRIDTLNKKTCGSEIQTAAENYLKNALEEQVKKQGANEINVEFTSNPAGLDVAAYTAGKPTTAYTPKGFSLTNPGVPKCYVNKSKE